jgi:hypothetical protein
MITPAKTTTITPNVYVQGFGQSPCSQCQRKTIGKLADYVVGSCGGYYANCLPLCSRCNRQRLKATAKPGHATMEVQR